MKEETNLAMELLRRAMGIEQEGHSFYLKAAEATGDDKGKETFRSLAGDEENHFELLKRQHDALKQQGDWIESPEIKQVNADLSKPLFPKGIEAIRQKITEKSSEMDALLFGLDIELKSYEMYRQANVADQSGKKMFSYLAAQEMGHFNLLMQRLDKIYGPITWYD